MTRSAFLHQGAPFATNQLDRNPTAAYIDMVLDWSGSYESIRAECRQYYTSNVLHHYRTDQYVAASLALFAAVALLFWYILQLVMRFSGRD